MDRFIDPKFEELYQLSRSLKSNMDRFIVSYLHSKTNENPSLKSNMDRFIEVVFFKHNIVETFFKIQYG